MLKLLYYFYADIETRWAYTKEELSEEDLEKMVGLFFTSDESHFLPRPYYGMIKLDHTLLEPFYGLHSSMFVHAEPFVV